MLIKGRVRLKRYAEYEIRYVVIRSNDRDGTKMAWRRISAHMPIEKEALKSKMAQ